MRHKAEILIVGAGVMGICSAYYLTERGHKVMVVDKGEVCSGCSYGNAGLVVPSHCIPLAAPGVISLGLRWLLDAESPFYIKARADRDLIKWLWLFGRACNEPQMHQAMGVFHELNMSSLGLYEELAAQKDLEFDFSQKGLLTIFKSKQGFEKGIREARLQHKIGLEANILNLAETQELAPSVRSDIAGGIYYPLDGHLDPFKFVSQLARHVRKKGGKILTSTEVIGFETAGSKVTTVNTTRGDITADQVVLAGGAFSGAMVRDLELKLPLQGAKGYSITYKRPKNCPDIPLLLSESKVILTPLSDMLRLGGTLELAGLGPALNRRRVNAIVKAAPEYLNNFNTHSDKLIEIWRGLRPCSPDGFPYLGRSKKYTNLIIAAGHAMKGMSLGPVTGKLVGQILNNERPSIDLSLMRVERFE